jgi:L-lactate dehydrogenase complex protein LldG
VTSVRTIVGDDGAAGARSEVLARIATALGRPAAVTRASDPLAIAGRIARTYQRTSDRDTRALVAEFASRATDYGASVTVLGSPDELAAAIAGCARPGRVMVAPGLDSSWLTAVPGAGRDDEDASFQVLASVGAAVTACAAAIAVTGTLILDHRPDQGRRALTLIPDHHVCVVRPDQIVATVPEAIARLDPGRPQTWISGPSATSDIELDRVVGVHGPRRLEIIVTSEPES